MIHTRSVVLIVAALLAACTAQQTSPEAVVPDTPVPTSTMAATEIVASEPTTAAGQGLANTPRTFEIVPSDSQASYTVDEEFFSGAVQRLGKQLGFFTTVGVTQAIEGQLTLVFGDTLAITAGQFTVDISTLTSDDRRRDQRIREQFLESLRFPQAIFTPLEMDNLPDNYAEGQPVSFQLLGEMTIREITQPMTFEVTATLEGDRLSGTAIGMLLMTDFGFDPPEIGGFMKAENDVLVTVDFTAVEVAP